MSTVYTVTWRSQAWWGGAYTPFQGLEEPEPRANSLEASQPPPRKVEWPRPPVPQLEKGRTAAPATCRGPFPESSSPPDVPLMVSSLP